MRMVKVIAMTLMDMLRLFFFFMSLMVMIDKNMSDDDDGYVSLKVKMTIEFRKVVYLSVVLL